MYDEHKLHITQHLYVNGFMYFLLVSAWFPFSFVASREPRCELFCSKEFSCLYPSICTNKSRFISDFTVLLFRYLHFVKLGETESSFTSASSLLFYFIPRFHALVFSSRHSIVEAACIFFFFLSHFIKFYLIQKPSVSFHPAIFVLWPSFHVFFTKGMMSV